MAKITIEIQSLINSLKDEGINFYFDDTIIKVKTNNALINKIEEYYDKRLENVVFEKNGIKYKISEYLFFRRGGQCSYMKKLPENKFEYADLEDKTFYSYQIFLIINFFKKYEKRI